MRKAFTLIELLVVVAILGLLMGLLAPQAGRALRSARESTCRTNLKNLQAACITHATDAAQGGYLGSGAIGTSDGGRAYLPAAGSYEVREAFSGHWHERRGWISWRTKSGSSWPKWRNVDGVDGATATKVPQADKMEDCGLIGDKALFGIRQGTLYKYLSRELGVYRCPIAANDAGFRSRIGAKKGDVVPRTYVMNEFFRFQGLPDWHQRNLSWIGTTEGMEVARFADSKGKSHDPESSRVLLFAEHSGVNWTYAKDPRKDNAPASASVLIGKDCVLHIPDNMADKKIAAGSDATVPRLGGYHDGPVKVRGTDGRLIPWGLVIFLDGHIEKVLPFVRDPNCVTKNLAWMLNRGIESPDK